MTTPDKDAASTASDALYGGIEAGGTKFVCAVGTGPDDIEPVRFPTTTPEQTLALVAGYFRDEEKRRGIKLRAVGIGSFGPVDLNKASAHYGYITATPKEGWQQTDLLGSVSRALNVPVGFDTDVNAAVLGESIWGACTGLESAIYLTIGTGVGGGASVGGRLVHGLLHPEMGHIRIPHDLSADPFPGACPFHGDCLEGLASGQAVKLRWGRPAQELPADHPAWALEGHYLALALVSFICTLSPQRIVMGGGIMQQDFLFPMLRREVQALLNSYIPVDAILTAEGLDSYIVAPKLGSQAGVLGAIALARQAAEDAP